MKMSGGLKIWALMICFVLASSGKADADIFRLELSKALNFSDKIASVHQSYLSALEDITIARAGTDWTSSLVLDSKRGERQVDDGDFNANNSRNVTVNVGKKLYDGGVGKAQESVAKMTLDLTIEQINLTEQNVLLEAIGAYTGLAEARDRVSISQGNVNRLEE